MDDDLTFRTHNVGVACYEVRDVVITYAGSDRILCQESLAGPKPDGLLVKFPNSKFGSYRAFTGLLAVRWQSADGNRHAACVDLDHVFPGRKILHNEQPERIYRPMPVSGGEPTIIVELNNRTLNLYMFATIQLVRDGDVTKPRDGRNNATLAFSQTF